MQIPNGSKLFSMSNAYHVTATSPFLSSRNHVHLQLSPYYLNFSKHEEIFQVQYNEQPPYEANTLSKKTELHFEKQHNCKNTTSQSTFEIIETHMSTSILS